MTSTDKVIQILTFAKETLKVSDEDLNTMGTMLGELQQTASNEVVESFSDPAGTKEITAFAGAAQSLVELDEEMRERALDALRALLLPREPSFLETLGPSLVQALGPVIAAQLNKEVQSAVPQGKDVPDAEHHHVFFKADPNDKKVSGVIVLTNNDEAYFVTGDQKHRLKMSDEALAAIGKMVDAGVE